MYYRGANARNNLTAELRNINNYDVFKAVQKTMDVYHAVTVCYLSKYTLCVVAILTNILSLNLAECLRGRVVRENGHECTYLVCITLTELYLRNMKTGVQ